MNHRTTSPANAFVTAGRLLLSALFVVSAITKLAAPSAIQGYIASVGLPFPVFLFWGTVLFEVFAGLLLATGYQTRWVALALAAIHRGYRDCVPQRPLATRTSLHSFLKNLAVAGGLLQLAAAGASQRVLSATRPAPI